MRFLVDAQLPPALARWLGGRGHDATHVIDIGLERAADGMLWEHALRVEAALITKDEDFALRKVLTQPGPAVVWVRCGNTTRRELLVLFDRVLPDALAALERGEQLVEVR